MNMKAWEIYFNYGNETVLDIVYFDADVSAEEVRRSLINHDGYHPAIFVREAT